MRAAPRPASIPAATWARMSWHSRARAARLAGRASPATTQPAPPLPPVARAALSQVCALLDAALDDHYESTHQPGKGPR